MPEHSESPEAGMDVRAFARMARRHWRVISAVTLLSTLVALGWSLSQPRVYSSTAIGMMMAVGQDGLDSAFAGDRLAQSKAISYKSLAMSQPVAEAVIEDLGVNATPGTLLDQVNASLADGTTEIRIIAEDASPEGATDLANSWLAALADQVRVLEASVEGEGEDAGQIVLQPVGTATQPRSPSSPDVPLHVALGFLGGLLAGIVYAYVRERMDRRIRSVQEIRDAFGVTVLGSIPTDERLSGQPEIIETSLPYGRAHHEYSEAIRRLRTNLVFTAMENPPRTIVITSSLPGEGRSSITANLSVAIASTGRNVVVIDGDLRRPEITDLFGLAPGPGVTEVLTGAAEVNEVLQTYRKLPNLQVLGAGRTALNPSELLSSRAMHDMLETLAKDAIVLIDAPPILHVTDGALLAASADGTVVVVAAQMTTTDALSKTLENLRQVQSRVLGIVLNRVRTADADTGHFSSHSRHDRSYYPDSDEQAVQGRTSGSTRPQQQQAAIDPSGEDVAPTPESRH